MLWPIIPLEQLFQVALRCVLQENTEHGAMAKATMEINDASILRQISVGADCDMISRFS